MLPDIISMAPLLWLVAFQMSLYAVGWAVCGALLGEDRDAVAHWGGFMLLLCVSAALAGARSQGAGWWAYGGVNLFALAGFALMRRGTERFLRAASSDREQIAMLLLLGGALALAEASPNSASWRVILFYGGLGYVMARMVTTVRLRLRAEFGTAAFRAIVIPGFVLAAFLWAMTLRQALAFGTPQEVHRSGLASLATYLVVIAWFNLGFMVMLTQRLVMQLRRASRRDSLTGLYNRGAIDAALHHQWDLSARSKETFAVLLIDVDHFKGINDVHGHAVGDRVLAHVASVIEAHARQADSLGRYGGEEFLVLAPLSDLEGARLAAERLRAAIEGDAIHARASDLKVTVSIGVAALRPEDPSVDALVGRADVALYRAKAGGRNRVESDS